MTNGSKWTRLRTPPAILAIAFALANLGWWVNMFLVPPISRGPKWVVNYWNGALPVYLPAALLGEWSGIDFFALPPLAWFFGLSMEAGQNYYRFIPLGVVGWGSVGYLLGLGISKAMAVCGALRRRHCSSR